MPWFDIDACRAAIAKKYDSPNWRYKVKRMPDSQIIAIYNRMFIEKPKHKKTSESEKANTYVTQEQRADPVVVDEDYYCEQLAIDL
jgi:hypothetical protein